MAIRRLLVLGSVTAVASVFFAPAASANPDTVDVCHANDDGDYNLISISQRAAAMHLANHGDGLPGDAVPGMVGFDFDDDCVPDSELLNAFNLHPVGDRNNHDISKLTNADQRR